MLLANQDDEFCITGNKLKVSEVQPWKVYWRSYPISYYADKETESASHKTQDHMNARAQASWPAGTHIVLQ